MGVLPYSGTATGSDVDAAATGSGSQYANEKSIAVLFPPPITIPQTRQPAIFDTRILKQIRRRLRADPITVLRMTTATDSEGAPSGDRSKVYDGMATITMAGEQEQLIAAARGTRIDRILRQELGLDLQADDWVVSAGITYEVVDVADARLYTRARLRAVI